MFRSLNGIPCSCSQARAFLQDVQLGDVYNVTIKEAPLSIHNYFCNYYTRYNYKNKCF